MKSVFLSFVLFIFLLGIGRITPLYGLQVDEKSTEAILNNVSAVEALAIANQWKWSKKDIKSYVTTREVILTFPNGRVKKIPLPEEKMIVAIAPYINQTHT